MISQSPPYTASVDLALQHSSTFFPQDQNFTLDGSLSDEGSGPWAIIESCAYLGAAAEKSGAAKLPCPWLLGKAVHISYAAGT